MILTARESPEIRREIMSFGVSQIDAGSRIELGGYSSSDEQQKMKEQFTLGDMRSLDEIIYELLNNNYIPSFCTSCYRLGRTGEHFMEFAIPGFIEKFCTPNALVTLKEYLIDYASDSTQTAGNQLIEKELEKLADFKIKKEIKDRLNRIAKNNERDLFF